MTECERLISNGTFTSDFFKPEVRCDFLVEEKRKKIWAVEIDLLIQFDKVCQKHGLRYFLIGGSLLGAVRHKGFIPWDDDVDVAMPRKDYNELLKCGADFNAPYFLQTPYSDPGYYFAFSRLRNSRTLYLSKVFQCQKINHGIPLDIFPLDDVIRGDESRDRFDEIMGEIINNSTFMRMSNPHLDQRNVERVRAYPGGDPLQRFELVECKSARDAGNPEARDVWFPSAGVYGYDRSIFPKSVFESSIVGSFEGFSFPIPVQYDKYLTIAFGDYMKLPPAEKRYPWYGADYFDADVSYGAFIKGIK